MKAGSQFEDERKIANVSVHFRFLTHMRQGDWLEADMYATSIIAVHVIKSLRSRTDIRLLASGYRLLRIIAKA